MLEAAAIVAEGEARERGVVMRIRVRLVERDRTLEIGERLTLLIERLTGGAAADMRLDVVGPQRERAIEGCNRLGGTRERGERAATIEMSLRMRGHDR